MHHKQYERKYRRNSNAKCVSKARREKKREEERRRERKRERWATIWIRRTFALALREMLPSSLFTMPTFLNALIPTAYLDLPSMKRETRLLCPFKKLTLDFYFILQTIIIIYYYKAAFSYISNKIYIIMYQESTLGKFYSKKCYRILPMNIPTFCSNLLYFCFIRAIYIIGTDVCY